MHPTLKRLLPHLAVIIGFVAISLLYFNPVLSGKMLYQNDIKLYQSMAQQHTQFRAETGTETYWTNGAFGGMPTYQMGAKFPHDYMDLLDRGIRFLPRPADYLFLYLLSFYILMLVMRVPWKLGVVGALAFGFSAYLIIIIGVGHNSKAHAIGYFPLVLAGILLVFQKRYLWGFLLTAVAMGLEIQANHYQMTYYLGILVAVLGVAYLIDAIRKGILPHYLKSVGILVVAVLLGLAMNATTLLATAEYAETSIRGEQLLKDPEATNTSETTSGLDYEYITAYSYGKLESLNLLVPKLMGLGVAWDLGEDSAFYKELLTLGVPPAEAKYYAQTTRLYWGDQPFVEAPPYLGVSVVLLALLGLFFINGRLRWWLIGGMVVSLALSWGKNLDGLTRFFVEYIPLYNKFRAVSSIQVILELLIPIAAVVGLHQFFNDSIDQKKKIKKLYIAAGILGGLCLIFYLFGGGLFNFRSAGEAAMAIKQPEILNAIKEDRITIMKEDSLRSLLFIVVISGVLWLTLQQKIKQNTTIALVAFVILIDLVAVDRQSVNEDNFITQRAYAKNFEPTAIDKKIMEDTSYFRVLDLYRGFNNPHTAYFFNTLNGYSAVYPRRIDDIMEQVYQGNVGIINMLNVKYLLNNEEGEAVLQTNNFANGPAWFVDELKFVPDHTAAYEALRTIDTKQTAILRQPFESELDMMSIGKDSLSSIEITSFAPNKLRYTAKNAKNGFAVFSEAYYKEGWKATIDGTPTTIYPVNYMLRGIAIPQGEHTIEFVFEPQVVQTGSMITLTSSILVFLLGLGGLWYTFKQKASSDQISD
ncbi:MAG: hypothetical protein CL867_03355 [Cytophagaceae bacterium]|nr:hypothetical protein [Cytophagaceae bacterium]